MASYVCAITSDSGLPLFTRRTEDLKPLPFATVGVLNGVHMFTNLRGAELQSAETPEERLLWKVYHNSITLILVTRRDETADIHFSNLLDNVFASMVLLLGIDLILKPGSVEKLKRELKNAYPLIDTLMRQGQEQNFTIGDLTMKADVLLSFNAQALMGYLEKFLEVADSVYACLIVKGKIVVASKQWWSLKPQEIILISYLVNCLPKATSREVPIFLPTSCPRTSNRLLILLLLKDIELCVLCGNESVLTVLDEEANKIWKSSFELLKSVHSIHPRNFPPNVTIDTNILSLLLVNKELNQTVFTICPSTDESLLTTDNKVFLLRQESIRTFYKHVVGTYFIDEAKTDKASTKSGTLGDDAICQAREYYMCTDQHNCYSINTQTFQIFLLFNKNIPRCALRSVSQKTLKSLTAKKFLQKCSAS